MSIQTSSLTSQFLIGFSADLSVNTVLRCGQIFQTRR